MVKNLQKVIRSKLAVVARRGFQLQGSEKKCLLTCAIGGSLVGALVGGAKRLATMGDWQLFAAKFGKSDVNLEKKYSLIIITNFRTNGMIPFVASTLLDDHFWDNTIGNQITWSDGKSISGKIRIWSRDYLCELVRDIVIAFDAIGKHTIESLVKGKDCDIEHNGKYIVPFGAKVTSCVPVFDFWVGMMFNVKQSKSDLGGELILLLQSDDLCGIVIPSHEFDKFIVSPTGIIFYDDHFPHWYI